MTFVADAVRMRFDDSRVAIVTKLKHSQIADGLDKLLMKAHECPRSSGRYEHCKGNSTAGMDANRITSGDVMLHTNIAVVGRKVIMSHFARSKSEPPFSTVSLL
ncbi:hypothetical protein, partial [Burkholderia anthina]|uniref:hypothetical protein n=1 Tax=Burkholderia anthina TaxID=179879 RepID=UPI001C8A7DC6